MLDTDNIELAQKTLCYIENPENRSRAVANFVAAKLVYKYFEDYNLDTKSGLHNVYQVLNNIDIADVYIDSNYIDVRVYFNEDELLVPKSHFDKNIRPVAYMFVKLDEDLSSATVSGFIVPDSINKETEINGYYKVTESDLVGFYDIESRFSQPELDDYDDEFVQLIFKYLDGSLTDTNAFYKTLIKSEEARFKLIDIAKAHSIFNFVSLADVPETTEISEPQLQLEIPDVDDIKLEVQEPVEEDYSLEVSESDDEDLLLATEHENDIGLAEEDIKLQEVEPISLEPQESEVEELTVVDSVDLVEAEPLIDADENNFDLDLSADNLSLEENTIADLDATEEILLEQEAVEEVHLQSFEEDANIDIVNNSEDTSIIEISEALPDESLSEEISTVDFEKTTDVNLAQDEAEEINSVETFEVINNDNQLDEELDESMLMTADNGSNEEVIEEYKPQEIQVEKTEVFESSEEENGLLNEQVYETETSEVNEDTLLEELDNDDNKSVLDYKTESTPSLSTVEENERNDNLDKLYEQEEISEEDYPSRKQASKLLPFITIVAVLGVAGYFGYTKFFANGSLPTFFNKETSAIDNNVVENVNKEVVDEPMPVETVEDVKPVEVVEEAPLVSSTTNVAAIEQNLNASISISDLAINWEVPASYVTNNTAKRYFTKIGKIIQLKLKSELLLQAKQPITDKIMVELEFNKNELKFKVKGVVASSGDTSIDAVISKTITEVLNFNLNTNMSVFSDMVGNPILVIKL